MKDIFWTITTFICFIIIMIEYENKVDECNINKLNCDSLAIENANLKNNIIELNLKYDSIEIIKDSLNSKLFISNYKIERIKKYNKIAAKGNNIIYLRGWINRVVND